MIRLPRGRLAAWNGYRRLDPRERRYGAWIATGFAAALLLAWLLIAMYRS